MDKHFAQAIIFPNGFISCDWWAVNVHLVVSPCDPEYLVAVAAKAGRYRYIVSAPLLSIKDDGETHYLVFRSRGSLHADLVQR